MAKKAKLTEAQKAAKFTELAEPRLQRAVKAIAGLQKLANTKRYHHSPAQVAKMKKYFEDALESMFAAYAGKAVEKEEITL